MLTEIAVQNSKLWNLFFSLLLKLGSADPINKEFLACVVLPLPNMSEASSRLILAVDHYAVLFTKKSFPEDANRGRNCWAQLHG